jgi:two-component system cell cycle response regulator
MRGEAPVVPKADAGTPATAGDRVMRLAVAAAVAWLVLYAALTALGRATGRFDGIVIDVAYVVPIVAAVCLSIVAARVGRHRARRAWTLLAVSNAAWLVGELIWLAYDYVGPGTPVVSIADFFYLSQYLIALPAILIGFGEANPLRRVRGTLDAALVAVALGTIGWQLVLAPALPSAPGLDQWVTFAYPVLGVAIVTTLVAVGLAGHHAVPPWVLLAGAAYAGGGLADAAYTYAVALHSYDSDDWLNIGWQVEAVLLCLAAVAVIRRPGRQPRTRQLDRDVTALPMVAAAVAVTGLVVTDRLSDGRLSSATLIIIVLLFAGLLTRQLLMTRDRTHLAAELSAALREQERLAITDGLTGLYNRRFFQEVLRLEADRATRHDLVLSLILIDLDEFKRVNDSFGHPAGDVVLAQVADRIRRAVRPSDVVARYGGEEFVCLLPAAGEDVALQVAEQVRRSISDDDLRLERGRRVTLTASLGIATAGTRGGRPATDLDGLVGDADAALYTAKAYGRNRLVAAGRLADLTLDTDPELPQALVWLADRIDAKLSDQEHSTAVSRWALLTGHRMGLEDGALRRIAAAGRLHDIGKINVSDAILTKVEPLTSAEWAQLRRHPDESARILTGLGQRPDLAAIAVAHHERYDGTGYPRGLAGSRIPVEARIVAVADAWAAMRADRPYAKALTEAQARQQITQGRGSQFDPVVADAFLGLVAEGVIDELAFLRHSTLGSSAQDRAVARTGAT